MLDLTVQEISEKLREADEASLAAYERTLAADTRKGVQAALKSARKRLDDGRREAERIATLYEFDHALADQEGAQVVLGMDEVGRGPLAGPLVVGGAVLDPTVPIAHLNDSKQLTAAQREKAAKEIRESARAFATVHIAPSFIDAWGIGKALRQAFTQLIDLIQEKAPVDLILLDGNPLNLDARERSIVKGDGKSASIAAASILAKVDRDQYMESISSEFPAYGFDSNKGYGSADHIETIKSLGLTPYHRKSFCSNFIQLSLLD